MNITNFKYGGIDYKISPLSSNDHIYKWIKKSKSFYELNLLEKISQMNLSGTFVDVGSNIGNHTLFFSNHCNSSNVYSYEIHPEIFTILESNVKNNVIDKNKVHIFNIGVGNKKSTVSLSPIDTSNVGMTKITSNVGNYPIDKLDNLLVNINNISLIKIDVEGWELNVLKGSTNILNNQKPKILAECATNKEFKEINNFLLEFNYACEGINLAHTPTYLWY